MDRPSSKPEPGSIIVPVGPGKGEIRPVAEALRSLAGVMRGHVNDLRDSGEEDQAVLIEQYTTTLDLILEQIIPTGLYGVGIPAGLLRLAKKYRLEAPKGKRG